MAVLHAGSLTSTAKNNSSDFLPCLTAKKVRHLASENSVKSVNSSQAHLIILIRPLRLAALRGQEAIVNTKAAILEIKDSFFRAPIGRFSPREISVFFSFSLTSQKQKILQYIFRAYFSAFG